MSSCNGSSECTDGTLAEAYLRAVAEGNDAEVIRLLSEGIAVDTRDEKGRTALIIASQAGCHATARLLISSGASIDAVDAHKWNALQTAAWNGHVEVVELLIAHEADVVSAFKTMLDVWDPLGEKNISIKRALFDRVVQRLEATELKNEILVMASEIGEWDLVKEAIEGGGDINSDGGGPLRAACMLGNLEMVRFLVDHGADPNCAPGEEYERSYAALGIAADYGFWDIVTFLLHRGADPNCFANPPAESTPLIEATKCDQVEVVRLLLEKGTNVNSASDDFGTALDCAREEVRGMLLDYGAEHGAVFKILAELRESKEKEKKIEQDNMNTPPTTITCPHCSHELPNSDRFADPPLSSFGYGLDFRLIPADSNLSSEIAICPECLYVSQFHDFDEPVNRDIPGNVTDLLRSAQYKGMFADSSGDEFLARGWIALGMRLEACGVFTLCDLGAINLRGSWAARELGCLDVESELLSSSAKCFENALALRLPQGSPGRLIYLLGEINRRRGEFLQAREKLTFLGNNPRYRYPALMQFRLVEEEDSVPYWSVYTPEQMEQASPRFKPRLFPLLRSIPPKKTTYSREEIQS